MAKLDERIRANLDIVLEETCRDLPHGGDHALRKTVAQRLLHSARKGNVTLGGLANVARTALIDATKQQNSA